MKILLPLVLIALLPGCASTDYKAYVAAQSEANRLAVETQKPMVRIVAHPGQPITGLASIEVYAPTAAPVIQQSRPNEWAGVLSHTLSVVGAVAGIRATGQAAIGLSNSVGSAATAGYAHIQAPGAVTTTTSTSTVGDNSGSSSGNSGRIAGTTMSESASTVGDNSGSHSGNTGRMATGSISDGTTTTSTTTSNSTNTSTVNTAGDTNSGNTTN